MNSSVVGEAFLIKKWIFSFSFFIVTDSWALTFLDSTLVQVMGEIGLVSVGAEKRFSRYALGGLYGFVPTSHSGGPPIETVTLRQTLRIYDWERFRSHIGLNIYHVLGLDYQNDKFRDSPGRYYAIGGTRALLNLGGEFFVGARELSAFYAEAGMNDLWIANSLSNRDTLNPFNQISLGLGFKHDF